MKLEHLNTHSVGCIIPLLLGVFSLCVADLLDPDDYRQIVAEMKEEIKTGRATSISSSAHGKCPKLFSRSYTARISWKDLVTKEVR